MTTLEMVRKIRQLKTETAAMVVLEHALKRLLKTNKEPVANVLCSDGVMPRCFLCESLKLESKTPLMAATKGTFICYDCIETLHEVMTDEKKGEKLKLPKGA